jgi:nucleoside-diphosphate kinase
MGKEQTFVMIKPDGVQRGLIGEIISRFEQKGIKIIAMKLVSVSKKLAEKHYEVHKGKPFFEPTVEYITSSPVIAMVLEGEDVITIVRNIVHGSDGKDTAEFEINLWFDKEELATYSRIDEPWLTE